MRRGHGKDAIRGEFGAYFLSIALSVCRTSHEWGENREIDGESAVEPASGPLLQGECGKTNRFPTTSLKMLAIAVRQFMLERAADISNVSR